MEVDEGELRLMEVDEGGCNGEPFLACQQEI